MLGWSLLVRKERKGVVIIAFGFVIMGRVLPERDFRFLVTRKDLLIVWLNSVVLLAQG